MEAMTERDLLLKSAVVRWERVSRIYDTPSDVDKQYHATPEEMRALIALAQERLAQVRGGTDGR